ncbi:MAG: radical SAM protein [Lachnospiraceae bacterium]|nr:radical SAM protein [Lachnospiraceae bacterium]
MDTNVELLNQINDDIAVIIQITDVIQTIPARNHRELGEGTVFSYLIDRLRTNGLRKIVVATTDDCKDDDLTHKAEDLGILVYRGSLSNIPKRLLGAAALVDAPNFVRVLGNYPFVDTDMMRELYKKHVDGTYDYSFNESLKGVIWGMGCEVFNTSFLASLSEENLSESQRQTVGIYIRQNQGKYRVFEDKHYVEKRPSYKLSLESERDYEVIREVALNVEKIDCKSVSAYLSRHPLTAKYNLEARPKEAGLEKLFLNLEKADNIIAKRMPDLSYPISVEMTLTNACNMNCVYCSDAALRQRQGGREMISLEDFKRLFEDLSKGGTKGIVIEGGGEPTLYSHFREVVECAVSSGLAVGLITNGSMRLDKDVICKFEWIRVSLDASTPEEYKALKGVDFYERVIDNIAYYAQHCNTVGVGFVVTKNNISQIEALVMRLRELKASYVQLRPVVDNEELYPKDIDLSYLKFYMTKDFGVQVDGMKENAQVGNHGLACVASSITSIISGDGSVYICGRLNVYDWLKPIGNITRESFRDIWYGEERKKQIEMISNCDFCKANCPQCRVSKFNVLFDKIYGITSVHFI